MSAKLHFREHINNQLILFPERIDKDIAPDDPVRLVNAVVDSLDMERIYSLYYDRGASPYHPRMMLKVIIYGYMNNIYSCRKIESALRRDVHFIWLAGYDQPDHKTINNFRNRVKDEINNVFTQLVLILAERGLISLEVEYIDGTKIESKANKYSFVWKKTVVKNRAKLHEKIRALLSQIDDAIAQENATQDESVEFTPAQLTEICDELGMVVAHHARATLRPRGMQLPMHSPGVVRENAQPPAPGVAAGHRRPSPSPACHQAITTNKYPTLLCARLLIRFSCARILP